MQENNLYIEETTAHLLPQRQNDSFIIEDMIATGIEGNILADIKYLGSISESHANQI